MSSPSPARQWSRTVKEWWRDFWASESGARVPVTARPAVWRLADWYHRRELLAAAADKAELWVKGSTGQPKVTPLYAELRAIDAQIEALERRVLGPQAAPETEAANDPAALLDAANRRFAELLAEGPLDADDPRLELVDGGAAAGAA